jgi:hypothetical protein
VDHGDDAMCFNGCPQPEYSVANFQQVGNGLPYNSAFCPTYLKTC